MENEIPVYDREAFLERLAGDREVADYILEVFVDQLPGQTSDLLAAVQAGDWPGAADRAHSIKGSAANVGAEQIRNLAQKAEKACERRDPAAVTALVGQIESGLQDFRQAATE